MERENEFIEIINPYQPVIYKVCLMYAVNKDDLCDLFQESLMNLWMAYPAYRADCKLSTWIYRICLNTCISDLRKKSKMKLVPLHTELELSIYDDHGEDRHFQELYSLIKRLNKIDRALILLWLDEKSYEEIASILQMSKSNVSVRLCRIKEKMKQMSNI